MCAYVCVYILICCIFNDEHLWGELTVSWWFYSIFNSIFRGDKVTSLCVSKVSIIHKQMFLSDELIGILSKFLIVPYGLFNFFFLMPTPQILACRFIFILASIQCNTDFFSFCFNFNLIKFNCIPCNKKTKKKHYEPQCTLYCKVPTVTHKQL